MKILLYSHWFWPSVGGIESVGKSLAEGWTNAGQQVTVWTDFPSTQEQRTPYTVVRQPNRSSVQALIDQHDLVVVSGASLQFMRRAFPCRKPVVMIHHGYSLQCLDNFGWVDDFPAPMQPLPSFIYHVRVRGLLKATSGLLRLYLRRAVATWVTAHVAVSHHLALRQPLARQRVIHNSCDTTLFQVSQAQALANLTQTDSTFTFLGRILVEKGLEDLLRAFALFLQEENQAGNTTNATLKVIGDGPALARAKALARQLNVDTQVIWAGLLQGSQLAEAVHRSGICVVPSAWEEPFGVTVTEFLAAGKPLIVSDRGGQAEVAGAAALSFPNGDYNTLAKRMKELFHDQTLQQRYAALALERAKYFSPEKQIAEYLSLFNEILAGSLRKKSITQPERSG